MELVIKIFICEERDFHIYSEFNKEQMQEKLKSE